MAPHALQQIFSLSKDFLARLEFDMAAFRNCSAHIGGSVPCPSEMTPSRDAVAADTLEWLFCLNTDSSTWIFMSGLIFVAVGLIFLEGWADQGGCEETSLSNVADEENQKAMSPS